MTEKFDISTILKDVSSDDMTHFKALLTAVREQGGDLSKLSSEELALLQHLKSKYANTNRPTPSSVETEVDSEQKASSAQNSDPSFDLSTPFSLYVKNVVFRELCKDGASWAQAIEEAFNNKWLPNELRNKEICETKFSQYESEINELNQWRDPLNVGMDSLNDKTMATGLAWFMKIYQFRSELEKQ